MKRLAIIFLLAAYSLSAREESLQTNFEILDSLAKKAAHEIISKIGHIDSAGILINEHPAGWLWEQRLIDAMRNHGIAYLEPGPGNQTAWKIELSILEFGPYYFTIPEKDGSLRRKIKASAISFLSGPEGQKESLGEAGFTYEDIIMWEYIDYIESSPYPFAKGVVPEKPGNFWKDVLEPAIIIGSAAIIALILFSARSE